MNDKFKELYADILKELWDELQRAEAVYLEISQMLLKSLNGGVSASRIAALEKHYQQQISGLIANLRLIYSGRIELRNDFHPFSDFMRVFLHVSKIKFTDGETFIDAVFRTPIAQCYLYPVKIN